MKFAKYLAVLGAIIFSFLYGIGVGVYHIFPYEIINNLKQEADILISSYKIDHLDTGLQRLLIKKIKYGNELGNGGALATRDDLVFISTNHGKLITFNWRTGEQLQNELESVPMQLSELKESQLYQNSNIQLQWFRVHDIYVEESGSKQYDIYATHHSYKDNCIWFKMSKTTLVNQGNIITQKKEWQEIFKATPCMSSRGEEKDGEKWTFYGLEAGGRIISLNREELLVSVGDHSYPGYKDDNLYSMEPNLLYGKIVLVNKRTGEVDIFAKGVRNPQGLHRDQSGNIWETEHGPQGGDELNLIKEGQNYGWPLNTYGINYGNTPWPLNNKQGSHNEYTKPIFSWLPSIGVSAIDKIEGPKFDSWQGDLLIGSLRAKSLFRLRLDENRVVYSEKIFLEHRIRDMATLGDGSIVLITDDSYIIFIEDGGPVYRPIETQQTAIAKMEDKLNRYNYFLSNEQKAERTGVDIFQTKCSSCHIRDGENYIAPSLNNIIGREVGGHSQFAYSDTLQENQKVWDENLLYNYILEPQKVFPTSNMPNVNLTAEEARKVVNYLKNN